MQLTPANETGKNVTAVVKNNRKKYMKKGV